MRHLTEEELIDCLFGAANSAAAQHLNLCGQCSQNLATLDDGLILARNSKPKVPLMAMPVLNHRKFKRKMMSARLGWAAAAAMFLISLLGFRFEMGNGVVKFELAMFSSAQPKVEQQIASLQSLVQETIQVSNQQAEAQINERLNLLLQEQQIDIGTFTKILDTRIQEMEFKNSQYLSAAKSEVLEAGRQLNMKGTLQ